MPNIPITISDDYAVVENEHLQFYYGYEETNGADEWCFVVRQRPVRREIFRRSASELVAISPALSRFDEPHVFLMVGMALFYSDPD